MRFEQKFKQFVVDLWLWIESQPQEEQGNLRSAVQILALGIRRK